MSQTTGGLYERFFEAMGKAVDGEAGPLVFKGRPDVGRIVEVAAEHGIDIPMPIAECSRAWARPGVDDRTRISRLHSYFPVEREGACDVYSTML
ncbi:MAG: hypothetical protein M3305_05010 [Actinomycetota bacterium]|nr:hypothetical protein [Actinomycetota bacterium]